MPIIGLFNALVAISCLSSQNFAGWQLRVAAAGVAAIVVALAALPFPYLAEYVVGLPIGRSYATLIIGSSQLAQIWLALTAWSLHDATK